MDKLLRDFESLRQKGIVAETEHGLYNIPKTNGTSDFLLRFWRNRCLFFSREQKRPQEPKMNFREAAADIEREFGRIA